MSVLSQNDNGWFICSKTYFNKVYKCCMDKSNNIHKLKFKDVYFKIKTPFLMNSRAKKLSKSANAVKAFKVQGSNKVSVTTEKNRPNNQIESLIMDGAHSLLTPLKNEKIIEDDVTGEDFFDNNADAKVAAQAVSSYDFDSEQELHFVNSSLESVVKSFKGHVFILPPLSTAHQCDVEEFFRFTDKKYDLILVDPPWPNRSVKRKHSYSSMKYEFLRSLPMANVTKPGCLLVVWATNSQSSVSFVLDDLFPKCSIVTSAVWRWCKVTQAGHFVYPLDSQHKKPYENIILGRVAYEGTENEKQHKEIEADKLVVSVPSSIHSHKPPLIEILQQYVSSDAECLELFARYLLPGWESVGNEVLKLQNIKLFEQCE